MSGRLILALDTATSVCSVALLGDGGGSAGGPSCWRALAERTEPLVRSHTQRLLAMIEECVAEVGAGPMALGAIVVGTGPGTFTGVRIGVATARAAAFALNIPVLGVSTLSAFAAGSARELEDGGAVGVGPGLLVPVCDARRGQLFADFYERGAEAAWSRRDDPVALGPEALVHAAAAQAGGRRALILGETAPLTDAGVALPPGVAVVPTALRAEWLVQGQELLREPGDRPLGGRLGPWLRDALAHGPESRATGASADDPAPGGTGTPEAVVPLYVRAPDADLHITKMRDPWAT